MFDSFGLAEQMKDAALKSPLRFAASVGGLRKGALQLGLSVDLPLFQFPGSLRPLSFIMQPKQGTASFFLRLDLLAMSLQSGVRGQLDIKIPQFGQDRVGDLLSLGGEVYLNMDAISEGVRAGVFCNGVWHNPFGFGNVNLTDTALVFGLDSNYAFELGFGGGMEIVLPEHHTSPFPSPLNPKESLAYLKDFSRGKKTEAIGRALADPATLQPAQTLKYGAGGLISVIVAEEILIPTKLALFYQADRGYDILSALEIYDVLIRGVLAGPAAGAILEGVHKTMQLTKVPDADKIYNTLKQAQTLYAQAPTLVDLFHLRDLPLFLLESDNLLFYFGTPGASLPGFPNINGLGFKPIGKFSLILFGKHELGAVDFELTLDKGLKIYAELGDLDLGGLLKIVDVKIDIQAGIPVLHGDPHFFLSGKTALFFAERDVLIDFSEKGFLVRARDSIGPFGNASIELASRMKAGKTFRDRDGLEDFQFQIRFEKEAVQKVLEEIIVDGLLGRAKEELYQAEKAFARARLRIMHLNMRIALERERARARIEATEKIGLEAADFLVTQLKVLKHALKDKRDGLGLLEKWEWPLLTAAMGVVDLEIAGAEEMRDLARQAIHKLQIPVDSDPLVWPLLAERATALVALKAADLTVGALKKLNEAARDGIRTMLRKKGLQDQFVVHNLELFSNSFRKLQLQANIDLEIAGKPIKASFAVSGEGIKEMLVDLSLGIARAILSGDSQELAAGWSEMKHDYTDAAARSGGSYHSAQYALKDGGLTGMSPAQLQQSCHLGDEQPEFRPGWDAWLLDLPGMSSGLYWGHNHPDELGTVPGGMKILLVRVEESKKGKPLSDGDRVALLSPLNRYVSWSKESPAADGSFSARLRVGSENLRVGPAETFVLGLRRAMEAGQGFVIHNLWFKTLSDNGFITVLPGQGPPDPLGVQSDALRVSGPHGQPEKEMLFVPQIWCGTEGKQAISLQVPRAGATLWDQLAKIQQNLAAAEAEKIRQLEENHEKELQKLQPAAGPAPAGKQEPKSTPKAAKGLQVDFEGILGH